MKKNILILVLVIVLALLVGYMVGGKTAEAPINTVPSVPAETIVVSNFDDCVKAGNPVMESYPRQCAHEGKTYVENIQGDLPAPSNPDATVGVTCTDDMRNVMCTQQYQPVCGLTRVECFTEPCNPVPETYSNGCTACSNIRVVSYTEGQCN